MKGFDAPEYESRRDMIRSLLRSMKTTGTVASFMNVVGSVFQPVDRPSMPSRLDMRKTNRISSGRKSAVRGPSRCSPADVVNVAADNSERNSRAGDSWQG